MSATVGSLSVSSPDTTFTALCDDDGAGTIVPFLRRYSSDAAGTVTTADTELDGVTPYTVVGAVTVCLLADAPPAETTPHGTQSTDWDLATNPDTRSVTLLVYAGTGTATTAEGALTVPAGTALTWSVDDSIDGALTGTLAIDGTAPAASWQVVWTTQ